MSHSVQSDAGKTLAQSDLISVNLHDSNATEQIMVEARDVLLEALHLTVFAPIPVATPSALSPYRMRAALRETTGIESGDAIGFTQVTDHLSDQRLEHRAAISGGRANNLLHNQALDIHQRRDFLVLIALQVGQQPLEVEHVEPAGLGPKSFLIGHDAVVQAIHYGIEHTRRNDSATQQFCLSLDPRRCHLFAFSNCHAEVEYGLEVIDKQ